MGDKTTFKISKVDNFSKWYSEILAKAEIADIRYNVKGFVVIRSWGALILEKMYGFYERALQRTGHKPVFFPAVIPEENFKKEASHVEGFKPEVFWLKDVAGEGGLALRPTSETAFYQMYNLWIRSWRDLPLKLYQRASVFRYETKATRPLIRDREFYWIEAHDCFATKKEAENQVLEDIKMTEEVMHKIYGVPFLPMKRPQWDKFPGADYTIGSDTIMPDGKIIQQPSTHLLERDFAKSFDVKFKDKNDKEDYVWQTCYGPAPSRILASVISFHGDDSGLVLPYALSPVQVVVVPIFNAKNKVKVLKEAEKLKLELFNQGIDVEVDDSDKRPGEKYFFWEMKGVPFRVELGEREIKSKKVSIFIRDVKKREDCSIGKLGEKVKKLGGEFDARLIKKADSFFKKSIVDCKNKKDIENAFKNKKIARFSFCSVENEGAKCAEFVEKKLQARVMGSRWDKKEVGRGRCVVCGKGGGAVVYAGKSY